MVYFTRIFAVFFWGFFLFHSCAVDSHSIKGNGNIVNKQLDVTEYEEIYLSGFGDVIYEQRSWDDPYLQVSVDDNIFPYLDIKVENGKLYIKPKDNHNLNPTRFKVYTSSSALNRVKISGSGDVHLKGELNSDKIEVSISGSGGIASDSLYCNALVLGISGSGKANLEGVCNNASFNVSGSGRIEAQEYQVMDLNCNVSGSGKMKVHANRSINATISGSGNIEYKGSPETVNQRVSGSGNIVKNG